MTYNPTTNAEGIVTSDVENTNTGTENLSVGPTGSGVTPVTDFEGNNLTIDTNGILNASGTGGSYTDEQVMDVVGSLLTEGSNIGLTYDDANDTLSISAVDTDTDTQLTNEEVEDIVGGFVSGSGATTVTYDDTAGTLTIDSTDTDTQLSDTDVQAIIEGNTDVSDLSGATGTSGQVPQTDGSTVSWADLPPSVAPREPVTTTDPSYVISDREIVLADSSSEELTLILPNVSDLEIVDVKRLGSSSVYIDTPGSETIDGQDTPVSVGQQYASLTITTDGTNYYII